MSARTYLSCADTAKLIRQALRESFPDVKFSVRSSTYSGGASIRIYWTDGPNSAQVDAVAQRFSGSYFDGGIDYKGCKYHALDGQPVRFGADFIFTERAHSDAAVLWAARHVVRKYLGEELLNGEDIVSAYRKGELWNAPVLTSPGSCDAHWNLQSRIGEALQKHSDRLTVARSPTCDRVAFTGDDGYGQGTVGQYFTGGDKGYAQFT